MERRKDMNTTPMSGAPPDSPLPVSLLWRSLTLPARLGRPPATVRRRIFASRR